MRLFARFHRSRAYVMITRCRRSTCLKRPMVNVHLIRDKRALALDVPCTFRRSFVRRACVAIDHTRGRPCCEAHLLCQSRSIGRGINACFDEVRAGHEEWVGGIRDGRLGPDIVVRRDEQMCFVTIRPLVWAALCSARFVTAH